MEDFSCRNVPYVGVDVVRECQRVLNKLIKPRFFIEVPISLQEYNNFCGCDFDIRIKKLLVTDTDSGISKDIDCDSVISLSKEDLMVKDMNEFSERFIEQPMKELVKLINEELSRGQSIAG